MERKCVYQIVLENTFRSSDKLYIIQVEEEIAKSAAACAPRFKVIGYYGRRGTTLRSVCKADRASADSAIESAQNLSFEKRRKGYEHMTLKEGDHIPGMPADAPTYKGTSTKGIAAHTTEVKGPLPMLASPMKDAVGAIGAEDEESLFARLMEANNWVLQRKYDGERILIRLDRAIEGGVLATNRLGYERSLPASAKSYLERILAQPYFGKNRSVVFDGEIIGEEIVFFDLAELMPAQETLQFEERYDLLHQIIHPFEENVAPVAWSKTDKERLYRQAQEENWEGVIFRNLYGSYRSGRCAGVLKLKFWNTCTCRVLALNMKSSIKVALRDTWGEERFVGNVTIPQPVRAVLKVGDLVEVKYLYALEGGSLYQPSFLRIRNDVTQADLRASIKGAPPEKQGALPL